MNKKMIGLVGLTGFMVAILVVALSGCAGPQVVPPASLDDQGPGEGYLQVKYQYYADNPTSDFEKVVFERALSAGSISPEDYEEAVARYLQCSGDAGYEIRAVRQANGIYQWLPQGLDESRMQGYMDATTRCAEGTTMAIEAVYKMQVANPTGADQPTAVVGCLRTYGVTDATYQPEDFVRDLEEGFENAPYTVEDGNVVMCLTSLGFAVEG